MLERILAETPDKVPALEALALLRERQGQIDEAIRLRQKAYALRSPTETGTITPQRSDSHGYRRSLPAGTRVE